MSTLSWNCRGLGNPRTVQQIVDWVSGKKPEFVFLMETKVGRSHAERLRVKLGYEGLFYVDNTGLSGGLALLWRKNNMARLLSYSKNYVDVEVTMPGIAPWRMTGYYGFLERNRRLEAWNLLRTLANQSQLPWVVIGDINDLLFQSEKRGGNPHPNGLLRSFGETIDDCSLAQMPMQGYLFTWKKGEGTKDWLEERLDKVLVTEAWRSLNAQASVLNLLTRRSDHSALFLGIRDDIRGRGRRTNSFRFEISWLHDEGCRGVVEEAWEEGRNMGMQDCLQLCGKRLASWGGDRFHKFGKQIKQLRKEQDYLRGRRDSASLVEFRRLEAELCRLEAMDDSFWRQRAKQHWLQGADANTRFFHSSFPEGLNSTNVVLIPKKKLPEYVTDLRPIVLSNVVYRIARLIADNILIAAEVGHYLNRKQCGKVGWGALKLDTAKAYDRMKWVFLRKMLTAMGFNVRWIDLIMYCVTTVSYEFLINGLPSGQVIPTRANIDEAGEVKRCRMEYEALSGHAVNYHKSSVCFSKNTTEECRDQVAQLLGVPNQIAALNMT
ncbi:PREDICTED: uncharacterized protein LOC109151960 [Ipomoea nil]|uniref:uncharacterized protein LOC109151960 n=1 Tax=Ipomoea nil TaxID=35883 RepID=UPI000901D018|nr:PREDICTED: uncharacterized protein LOC109151960 [Ipomoea nil]